MTDAILIKLAQYQTETRNQKKELKTYSQKLLDREEEMKEIKKEYEEKIKLLKKGIIIQTFNFLLYQENSLSMLFLLQVVFLYDQAFHILFANG